MWSLTFLLLAATLRSAAALPLTDADLSTPQSRDAFSSSLDARLLGIDVGEAIASLIPLDDFGTFETLTLEQVVENSSLLETATSGLDKVFNSNIQDDNAATAADDVQQTNTNTDAVDVKQAVAAAATTTTGTCARNRTRFEWRNYQVSDRRAFVDAIACLQRLPSAGARYAPSTSRYEDFVQTHQVMTDRVHDNGLFLPWHRYFVWAFERALRGECGFEDGRAMPWWDETLDSGRFAQSTIFTADYFGSLPTSTGGAGTCITDGKFANLTCHIGPGTDNVDHCLSRAVNEEQTTQASTAYVEYCAQQTVYGKFESCAEKGPHAWGHNGIGSIMADVYSSTSDPVFFLHHLFVDHQYASWQEVDPSRKTSLPDACADGTDPCGNTLDLGDVLDLNGLAPNITVGEVINTRAYPMCYKYDSYYAG